MDDLNRPRSRSQDFFHFFIRCFEYDLGGWLYTEIGLLHGELNADRSPIPILAVTTHSEEQNKERAPIH